MKTLQKKSKGGNFPNIKIYNPKIPTVWYLPMNSPVEKNQKYRNRCKYIQEFSI